jgi:predicted nucleic acid-binding protein
MDASAALEISMRRARGIDFVNIIMNAGKVLAPDLYMAEIANIMWKYTTKFKGDGAYYRDMADDCIDFVDEYVSAAELWREALREGQGQKHSICDMLYVVLAKRNDAKLLTVDSRLEKICASLSVQCG